MGEAGSEVRKLDGECGVGWGKSHKQGSNRVSVCCVKNEVLSLCPAKLFRPNTALIFF